MRANLDTRRALLLSTGIAGALLTPMHAMAQEAENTGGGLEEIVVTAQRREQSLQDVPIAVTAVTAESLQANRIFTVNDLSAIAPGVTVKPSPGGSSVPVFTIRGQSSFGVVPGSDKQVSIYIDGVYVSSPRGSIFELPDIERLEVLRGPQGTLFGRNSTAGAISITTRDPSGDPRIRVEGTIGNRDAYRMRMTAELPQMGPFSVFGSYVHNYRRGEVRNAGGGTVWNRTLSPSQFGTVQRSPNYLGTVDSTSYFGAVKFEPSDTFKMVYKFDRNDDEGSPDVTGFIGFDPNSGGGLLGGVLAALYGSNQVYAAPDGKRPKIAANSFAVNRTQKVFGHSLTSTWQATDNLSIKNITAYRQSTVLGPTPIDGASALTFTPQALGPFAFFSAVSALDANFFALPQATQQAIVAGYARGLAPQVGNRLLLIAAQSASVSKQWSSEVQANYTSGDLQATVGALWFHSRDVAGGPSGMQNTLSFAFIPQSGVIPLGNQGEYRNKATSIAAYAQLEYKITPELEVVAGARITKDKKTSTFLYDVLNPATGVISPRPLIVPPAFKKTKPNYLIGVNWRPQENTLLYGKFSTSFVSGGSTGGLPYEPETAKSFEVGAKVDFLDRKLRANLALFHVDYNHFQASQSTSTPSSVALALPILTGLYGATTANEVISKLSVFVGDQGKVRAKGFELELTAAPTRGLTLGGSASYTDTSFPFVEPLALAGNGGRYEVTGRPKWTGSVYGTYETEPLFNDTRLVLRGDAFYQGKFKLSSNRVRDDIPVNRNVLDVDGYWTFNSRISLRNLMIGPVSTELAVWGKNLSDRKDVTTALFTPLATSASYVPARTYGLDLIVEF